MYENKTYENIKENILEKISDIDKREGSFVNDMVSPVAMEFEGAYQQFEAMLGIMFMEDSVGEYIEKRAKEYGILRKKGTYATGNVTFTGKENTHIPKGSLISTINNLLYETVEDAIISQGKTTITVPIKAQETGDKYNVLANMITSIPVAIMGITSVINTTKILGGTDVEADTELVNRVLLQIQNPATSGNAMHYKLWALEVDGVGDAKVFPLYSGPGTVMVMPITSDKRAPDATIIENTKKVIEEKRPIGATVTVYAPTEVLINVTAQIVLEPNYTLQQIQEKYTKQFKKYIMESVFKLYTVDFYKCLSIFYEIEGVKQVIDFKINNATSNITIKENQIQVAGTIAITE